MPGWKYLLAACLMLTAAPGFAQTYDVVGVVMDAEKGEPIGAVQIYYQSGKYIGITKSNGRFEITVNSRSSVLVFKRHTYKDAELNLGDATDLIGVEVGMQSDVVEIREKTVETKRGPGRDNSQAQSIERLEALQGMRIDLNDHLRQLPGVSGMNEFTNDISVYGSRTGDVTHYLGQGRIPSLRHLDFGFPGNQSVLNPRLLKSVAVSDNPARGPLNQGNASALVYDLKDGDPDNITGDMVFGTVNRELNFTGYWGGRTFILSGRLLSPTFLSNLGSKFFTESKDVRLRNTPCDSGQVCRQLSNPFTFNVGDAYVGTYYRDSTGAYARHSVIWLDDEYTVEQDVSTSWSQVPTAQTLVKGTQDGWMYVYDGLSPHTSGDLQYSFGFMRKNREEVFRDTLPPSNTSDPNYHPWYPADGTIVDNLLGSGDQVDLQFTSSFQWNSNSKVLGAAYGYGLDLEYDDQDRIFFGNGAAVLPQDYTLANTLFRLRWSLANKQTLEASAGTALVYQGMFEGADAGMHAPLPLASLRYSRPLGGAWTGYGEAALRQNTAMEPTGYNRLNAVSTSSTEGKIGANADWGNLAVTSGVYSRLYLDPTLPTPEVFWNYEETRKSDLAYVGGGTATVIWTPSHHAGINVNASVVRGQYNLADGGSLPWESNRTLDLVSNLRILPRKDSLLSLIVTYTAANGAPLYEYTNLWNGTATTLQRTVRASRDFPTVSRQRTDVRVNLDLKSKFRPLQSMRFFFEADNIFADANSPALAWLGGDNEKRRGWTRSNATGDLLPIVTRGMGLFVMFGFEGKLLL